MRTTSFLRSSPLKASPPQYKVQLVTNGDEAIAYLKGDGKFADRKKFEFPSYILTDLQMNPGDGFNLLEFIKRQSSAIYNSGRYAVLLR